MSTVVKVVKLIQSGKCCLSLPTWKHCNNVSISNLNRANFHFFNNIKNSGPKQKPNSLYFSNYFKGLEPHKIVNIQQDIILYANDNIKYYRLLNLFSFSQGLFWLYLSHFAYTSMTDTHITQEEIVEADKTFLSENPTFIPIWRRFNLGKYKTAVSSFALLIGVGCISMTLLYTKCSVRYLLLNKGGERVTLQFFSLFGKGKEKIIPLNDIKAGSELLCTDNYCHQFLLEAHPISISTKIKGKISAKNSRQNAKSYVVLKLKNRLMHLVLDAKGEFPNKDVFDRTVGLRRAWDK